jgi:hypothetical protein
MIEIVNQILESFVILKVALLVVLLFHTIFLFVVFTQVNSMDNIIKEGSASVVLKLITLTALIASASLFLVALVIL